MWKRVVMAMFVASVGAATASAQTAPAGQQPAAAQPPTMDQQAAPPMAVDNAAGDDDVHGGHGPLVRADRRGAAARRASR